MPVKPADLLAHYDADESEGIDALEVERLFAEAALELSPELVVAQMDSDDSNQLEAGELVALAWMASEHVPPSLAAARAAEAAGEEPPEPGPAGPGTHFGRLDVDKNGYIDEDDLRALQNPIRLEVWLPALFSALDRDGDGRLSEREFRASMTKKSR